jgi:molybdate transport system substrate-binding protein
MKRKIMTMIFVLSVGCLFSTNALADEKLMLFCGAGLKPPFEELTQIFTRTSGIEITANYASVGALYSQVLLSKQGDLFVVPSPDLMTNAITKGVTHPDSVRNLGYVVPAIHVQKGNPKNIKNLRDLVHPGIRLALGNPETVFIGTLAVEIIEKGLSPEEKTLLRRNLVTYSEDFPRLSSLLLLQQVDAIIGFHYLGELYPDKVETLKLKPEETHRIGAGQIAVLSYSKNVPSAVKFIDFLLSEEGKKIFKKYHYFGTPEEAFAWIGGQKSIGGAYTVPQGWIIK